MSYYRKLMQNGLVLNMSTPNGYTLPNISAGVAAETYSYLGVNEYRFYIKCVPTAVVSETTNPTRFRSIPGAIRYFNTEYKIKAAAVIDGVIFPYIGNEISVFTGNPELTKLDDTQCGLTLSPLNATLSASIINMNYIVAYRFRLRFNSDVSPTPTYYFANSVTRFVSMNDFIGLTNAVNNVYAVAIQYQYYDPNTATNLWSNYGAECVITMPSS